VESITILANKEEQNSLPPSEQAAVAPLIQIGQQSFNRDEALEVALVVLECLSLEMLSPEAMALAFISAGKKMPDHTELIIALYQKANQIRKGNPISGMF